MSGSGAKPLPLRSSQAAARFGSIPRDEPIVRLTIGGKMRDIDASIAPVVKALNDAGITTVASCSGHGYQPGNIILADGRELLIAPDFATAREVESHFPGINGETPRATRGWRAEILPPGVMGPNGIGPDHWKLVIRQDGEVFDLVRADDLPTILQALADRTESEAHHETD